MPNRVTTLLSPLGGLDERASYRQQPPYRTPLCLNVIPNDPLERRGRVGQRWGLSKVASNLFAGPIRLIDKFVRYDNAGGYTIFMIVASDGDLFSVDSTGTVASIANLAPVNFFYDGMLTGAFHRGYYWIPDPVYPFDTGSVAGGDHMTITQPGAYYVGTYTRDSVTLPQASFPGGLIVSLSDGTGSVVDGDYGVTAYTVTGSGPYTHEVIFAGPAAIGGPGTASYAVHAPMRYIYKKIDTGDLYYGSVSTTSRNLSPPGCHLICVYRDRLVLAGNPPHMWYMSRVGRPTDWNYGADEGDVERAIYGGNIPGGAIPGEMTALAPQGDDYLIMAGEDSLHVMRGDPAYGGTIDTLSYKVGIVAKRAWCYTDTKELVFLSKHGLYMLPAGASSEPVNISRESMPKELVNLRYQDYYLQLQYDGYHHGVHIFLTRKDTADPQVNHWWFDLINRGFWPLSYSEDHEATSIGINPWNTTESDVVIGGRDGYLRKPRLTDTDDDGTAISSYCMVGPIALANSTYDKGILLELKGVMDEESGNAIWSVHQGDTPEQAISAAAFDSGTWGPGRNYSVRPKMSGHAMCLKLANDEGGSQWAFEDATAVIRTAGPAKVGK